MARVAVPGFVGGSGKVRSRRADVERTVNFYLERADGNAPAGDPYFIATPGIQPFVNLLAGSVRGLFYESTYRRLFAVGGSGFYEVYANRTIILRGVVAVDDNPATISSNGLGGHQLFITSGGQGYIFDLNVETFGAITDDGFNTPSIMGLFTDGYFLNLYPGGFQLSSLEDGLVWDGLDVAQVSQAADAPIAMGLSHREVWLWGTKTTNPWYDSGAGSFPFEPIQGGFIEVGIAAPFAFTNLDNTLYWLTENSNGAREVVRANGYAAQRVSTHAVEFALNQAPNLNGTLMFAQQDEGHAFLWVLVPSLETTWVYDVSTQAWHERALWNTDAIGFEPHIARDHVYCYNRHLVGDRSSGVIYEMSLNLFADDLVVA